MKVFADAVVPGLFADETVLRLLPYLFIAQMLGVCIAVNRLVLRKNSSDADKTIQTEDKETSEDDVCDS